MMTESHDNPRYVYAVIRENNIPIMATSSREHAFEECRRLAKPLVVSFDGWINGDICRVSNKGETIFRIFCLKIAE
jgi:hypothetical protein